MLSYIPQDKSYHPTSSGNRWYSSCNCVSMDDISWIQQFPLFTFQFVASVSDPVHTETRGRLLEKKRKTLLLPQISVEQSKQENVNSSGKMFLKGSFRYFMPLPAYNIISSRPAQWVPLILLGSSVSPLKRMGLPLLLPHRSPSAACLPHTHPCSSWPCETFHISWGKAGWISLYQDLPAEGQNVFSLLLWVWEDLFHTQPLGDSQRLQCCCWHDFQELSKL